MAGEEGTNTQSVGSTQSAPTAPEEPSTPATTLEQGQGNVIEADVRSACHDFQEKILILGVDQERCRQRPWE
jgi:hypothetical protein